MSKEEIKKELTKYEPTPEERTVIRGAVFNFISLGTSRPIASSLYTDMSNACYSNCWCWFTWIVWLLMEYVK